ncbi:unnamed protein product [Clonostachys chloroleuca]|uniref:Zn(2)-C6 fungal-type domain-containing protein n=1 Tax=Clonostachys chloroleuca TaxID=1926264 RepID=A0AA35Q4U2_9HYPO|nr:unnamed protein product [Clonostachys chloroleuca]
MPSIRHIPDSKRRSRRGCLPCRKRRRKCDEQKPECGSCTARNVACVYPQPTFVFESQRGKGSVSGSTSGLENDAARVDSASPDANLDIPAPMLGRFGQLVDLAVQQPDVRGREPSPSLPFYAAPIQRLHLEDRVDGTRSLTERPARQNQDKPASSCPAVSTGTSEAGLLTSFVADIVPWIVSTCPGSRFANSVIGLASHQPVVRNAMVALVRTREEALNSTDGKKDFGERGSRSVDAVERELGRVEDTLAVHVARSLLSVTRLFGSRPTYWSKVGGSYLHSKEGLEEPLRYLLQMQGKIELASCLLTEEPPSMSLVKYLEQSVSAPDSAIRTSYLACLSQLAQCLHLTYSCLAQLTARSGEPQVGSPTGADPAGKAAEAWSSWHTLWARCINWYQARPLEMEPIFGFSSGEPSAESSASFPIEIYSTPIALQANMAIHLSFIVLIAHKPRLLKLSRSEVRLGSESWHAQKIAGMAAWNHFQEQFDPLFVAALLLAAERMTHESQQVALLKAFRDIERKMGIVLDDQIARLERIWQTFRLGHVHRVATRSHLYQPTHATVDEQEEPEAVVTAVRRISGPHHIDVPYEPKMDAPMSETDHFPVDPRFLELHEELRHVVLSGIVSLSPSRWPSPEPVDSAAPAANAVFDGPSLDFTALKIPQSRLIRYLQNWVTECAPILDKFDTYRQFQIQVPLIARSSPAVLYAMLTFSSRQMERRGAAEVTGCFDSPELYQESIRLLTPALQAKDPNVLVAVCILAMFELMSWNSTDWRRHLEGCAAILGFFGVNGFTGGIAQAMFWCYARMEICGAIISDGTETAVYQVSKWIPAESSTPSALAPDDQPEFARALLHHYGREWHPDMHANWATYLCAKVCDLRFRRTQHLELEKPDAQDSRPFSEKWHQLWRELRRWVEERPPAMLPVPNILSEQQQQKDSPFPTILFSHNSAISGNQLYHTACILMLEIRPPGFAPAQTSAPESFPVWHARRICGISCSNPHNGSRIDAIQPLYIAGRLFTHVSERMEIARLLRTISRKTGWGAWWRLQDLEAEWGCEYDESLTAPS